MPNLRLRLRGRIRYRGTLLSENRSSRALYVVACSEFIISPTRSSPSARHTERAIICSSSVRMMRTVAWLASEEIIPPSPHCATHSVQWGTGHPLRFLTSALGLLHSRRHGRQWRVNVISLPCSGILQRTHDRLSRIADNAHYYACHIHRRTPGKCQRIPHRVSRHTLTRAT